MRFINSVRYYFRQFGAYHISTFAASASFFIISAIFPLLMLILSVISFTPLSAQDFMDALLMVLPASFRPLLAHLAESLFTTSATALSVSLITTLWTASKSMLGLLDGLNAIADVNDTRNFIFKRIVCMGYVLVLIAGLVVNLGLRVFGQHILAFLQRTAPRLAQIFSSVMALKGLTLFAVLALIFMLIYTFFPNKKMKVLFQIPGALFTSLAWLLFSSLFSIYVNQMANASVYGGLTTAILAMLWLYFCLYIFFIGALVNKFFPDLFQWGVARIKGRQDRFRPGASGGSRENGTAGPNA